MPGCCFTSYYLQNTGCTRVRAVCIVWMQNALLAPVAPLLLPWSCARYLACGIMHVVLLMVVLCIVYVVLVADIVPCEFSICMQAVVCVRVWL
jgi:hypothetical protein